MEDGQPGAPGELELEFNVGFSTTSEEEDETTITSVFEYTLYGSDFLRNMQLSLEIPVDVGAAETAENANVTLGWQQRWVAEHGLMPTIATLVEIRTPTGDESSGADGTYTGIVSKDFGPGTATFNVFLRTASGDNGRDDGDKQRDFQWGVRSAYKWRINDTLSFVGDYVHQANEERGERDTNLIELSSEYHVNDDLTIGPGISFGVDGNQDTMDFGAGVRVVYGFK